MYWVPGLQKLLHPGSHSEGGNKEYITKHVFTQQVTKSKWPKGEESGGRGWEGGWGGIVFPTGGQGRVTGKVRFDQRPEGVRGSLCEYLGAESQAQGAASENRGG